MRYSPMHVAALLLAMQAGCGIDVNSRQFAERTTGGSAEPLAPPEVVPTYSGYEPENAATEMAPGLLSQRVYDTEREAGAARSPLRYRIEARNLLVGPGRSTDAATLPGGAVFEVRAGTGTITIRDAKKEITTGSTFAVSEGDSFRLANDSESELALRVYVIRLR